MPRLINNLTGIPLTRNQTIKTQVTAYALALFGGLLVMTPVVREYKETMRVINDTKTVK